MAYLVSADRILPGPAGQQIRSGAVLIDAGTIVTAGPRERLAELAAAQAAVELDFPGSTILPGLINAHVHLAFNGRPDRVDELMNCHDDARLVLAMAGRSHQLLDSGVTTVRDLGDRNGLTIQLRDAIAAGDIAGPRILAATAPLTPPDGHCWFLGGQVDGPEEIRAQIERNAAARADLIKVMVSGGSITPGAARMWEPQFHADDLKVAVRAAHRLGLPVAAHTHGLSSIRSAIDAGVDTIEHCTWLDGGMTPNHDEQTVADLAASGIAVCTADSNSWRVMAERLGEQRAREIIGRVRWMRDRGVRLIIGTDAGLSPFTGRRTRRARRMGNVQQRDHRNRHHNNRRSHRAGQHRSDRPRLQRRHNRRSRQPARRSQAPAQPQPGDGRGRTHIPGALPPRAGDYPHPVGQQITPLPPE